MHVYVFSHKSRQLDIGRAQQRVHLHLPQKRLLDDVRVFINVYICVCVYSSMYVCNILCIYVRMYMYMYVYIYHISPLDSLILIMLLISIRNRSVSLMISRLMVRFRIFFTSKGRVIRDASGKEEEE